MFDTYRALLTRPHVRPLLAVCALGWLAYCGYVLAVVLTVHAASGSFARAGLAVAGQAVGIGALAPVRGRWVDHGGARALQSLAALHCLAAGALLAGARWGGPAGALLGAVAFGASSPPLVAVLRTRLSEAAGPALASAAHALNASLADGAQLASPAIVAALALLVSPALALGVLVLAAAGAALALARRLGTGETARAGDKPRAQAGGLLIARGGPGLRTLLLAVPFCSAWVAGLELLATATAARHGVAALGAIPLIASAVGSIGVSLVSGARLSQMSAARRYLAGLAVNAAALPLILLAPTLAGVTGVLVLAGAGLGLQTPALWALVDVVSPPGRSIETFNWLTTAATTGGAVGAAVTGRLVHGEQTTAVLVLVGCAAAGTLLVGTRRRTLT